jgi:hypothetical protein
LLIDSNIYKIGVDCRLAAITPQQIRKAALAMPDSRKKWRRGEKMRQ